MASDLHTEHQRLVASAQEHAKQAHAILDSMSAFAQMGGDAAARHFDGLRHDLTALALHGGQWEQDRDTLIDQYGEAIEQIPDGFS